MKQTLWCASCGNSFNPDELCSRCAMLYNYTMCFRCCASRGICTEILAE